MATLNDFAKRYANRLKETPREQRIAVLRGVQSEINELVYSGTKEKISSSDKAGIYKSIKSELKEWLDIEAAYAAGAGHRVIAEHSNDSLIDLINAIIDKLGG